MGNPTGRRQAWSVGGWSRRSRECVGSEVSREETKEVNKPTKMRRYKGYTSVICCCTTPQAYGVKGPPFTSSRLGDLGRAELGGFLLVLSMVIYSPAVTTWLNRGWRVSEVEWQRPPEARLRYQRHVTSAPSVAQGVPRPARSQTVGDRTPDGHAFPAAPGWTDQADGQHRGQKLGPRTSLFCVNSNTSSEKSN